MICIRKIASNTLHYDAVHFRETTDIWSQINQNLHDSGLTWADLQANKLVLDFKCEGHCDKSSAELINFVQTLPVKDLLVVFNASVDVEALPYRAVSMPYWMVVHNQWLSLLQSVPYNSAIDHKFLCLMRRPSPSRAKVARWLLDHNINARFSFASMYKSYQLVKYMPMFPDCRLPITIDGIIDRAIIDAEHTQINPIFHSCLFNLVVETSSQNDPGIWHSVFITEKTFKAFGLRQIPIWFAVPGLVTEVRKLGFDMFDDIVDHSYDLVYNENERFSQIFAQIQRFNHDMDLKQCQQLRDNMHDRLNNNFDMLLHYASEANPKFQCIIQEFDEQI
jgi:hypothetical protein